MTSALDQLISLIPPGRPASPHPDWSIVERNLGAGLPEDYKHLVNVYGPGTFDGFLWVLQPMPGNKQLDLVAKRDTMLNTLRTLADDGEVMPHPPDRLLPWAATNDGDICFWLRDPPDEPDKWSVVANESRGPIWEEFAGSATEFLLALMSGSLHTPVFPDDFPSEQPSFNPHTG